jgi:hypothetical protein
MNNNQHDALFILRLLSYHTSTSFGVSAAHHQEVNGTCYTVQLTVSGPGWNGTHSHSSHAH